MLLQSPITIYHSISNILREVCGSSSSILLHRKKTLNESRGTCNFVVSIQRTCVFCVRNICSYHNFGPFPVNVLCVDANVLSATIASTHDQILTLAQVLGRHDAIRWTCLAAGGVNPTTRHFCGREMDGSIPESRIICGLWYFPKSSSATTLP